MFMRAEWIIALVLSFCHGQFGSSTPFTQESNIGNPTRRSPILKLIAETQCAFTQNIYFECGWWESAKYTMCDRAMTEANHTTKQDPPNHPCAKCFAKGLAGNANQTWQRKVREARTNRHTSMS